MVNDTNNQNEYPILLKVSFSDCCGCESCVTACPTQAIAMRMSNEGFYYPSINEKNKCIKCAKCTRVCPLLGYKKRKTIDAYYAGYSNNSEVVLNSSSGGLFSEIVGLYTNNFTNGANFVGVVWNDSYTGTEFLIGKEKDDLIKIRRSKYIQAEKHDIYKKIEELLKTGEYVLFSGCPCEVAALYAYLGREYDNLFTVDLVCQGPSAPKAMEQFVENIEKKYSDKIIDLNMRFVNSEEWIPQWIRIQFSKGRIFLKPFYETDIGRCVHIMQRSSCYSCKFVGNRHVSDLTLGDYHGVRKEDDYYNSSGTSILITNTEKGRQFIYRLVAEKDVLLEKANKEDIRLHNPRIYKTWGEEDVRYTFSKEFVKKGLHSAARNTWTLKEKFYIFMPYEYRVIKKKIKNIIKKAIEKG